ncbi:hypothetical protein [Wenyingzhuangia sp. IMCC45574]
MKKFLLLFVLLCSINYSFGQNFSELKDYTFKTAEEYKTKDADVLKCANYLFNHPVKYEEHNRLIALQFIFIWATGTPDYTFDMEGRMMKLTKGNEGLLGLYFAAMCKVVLENNGTKLSRDEIYNQSEALLVAYCADKGNKIKPSKAIKKILKKQKKM